MAYVESSKTISTKGVGRPDYTGEQWQAKIINKYELHYNEVFKSFAICGSLIASPYPHIVPPIAVGVPTSFIDMDTGFPTPFTVPAGYELEILQLVSMQNQNGRGDTYLDGFFIHHTYVEGFAALYQQNILGLTTASIDPTFALPHTIDLQVINTGLDVMCGLVEVDWVLRLHHTEIPTIKTIRCKWCGNTTSVSLTTVQWTCPKCGKLNLYYHRPSLIKGGSK
jgi:phage FluMu protein Com